MVTFIGPKQAKKVLITSALPYVNNFPHLGTLIGCVLSADVFSRYCKLKKYDSLYVCGTDEHGTATETKAIEEGVTPQEICDKYFKIHTDIYKWFNIEFDIWGRTSTKEHEKISQEIFLQIYKNGYIQEKIVEQLFCKACDKFLADRFVEGECPYCNFEDARGDQCDNCQKLLNAIDLINPRCKLCNSLPEKRTSEHLFLDLEKLQNKLVHWSEKQKDEGYWTDNAATTTQKWIKQGLKPRAISRDLKWGVNIPLEKYKNKVFYVWFDAPIGYISITAKARPDWKDWWQNPDVKLFQFMAKDNIPFHTIMFPATLLATKDNWTLLHHINSTEYLNYETGKFSKSRSEGVFGDDAMETGIPADAWRYYLLAARPENSDTTFTWKDFQEKLNNELVANFANLVNRTVVFISKFFEGEVFKITNKELDSTKKAKEIEELYEQVKLRKALQEIMSLSRQGNKYFQDKAPWKSLKENPEECKNTLANLYNFVKDLSIIIWPYLPKTSEEIWNQLGIEKQYWKDIGKDIGDKSIGTSKLLFAKLEDKEVKEFQEKFKGESDGKAKKKVKKTPTTSSISTEEKQDIFSGLQLKVAEIVEVRPHPKADKLLIMQIDIGEEKPRQLVAGLKAWYKPDDLKGKKLIVISNLQPAKLRGEKSDGMLLAASIEGDKDVGILYAQASENGSLVYTEKTKSQVFDKSKKELKKLTIEEFSKLHLESKVNMAWFDGDELKTDAESIKVDKDIEGSIH
ncbi:MAG: methionine--tRNA ligase [Nanoarchaeota archaeon]|nr:methionine--tRNA ligase [Nanoarchaeota archaeon]